MNHRATPKFWRCYHGLPKDVRAQADRCFAQLKADPTHPSLHFKKIGTVWSARVGLRHRALAIEDGEERRPARYPSGRLAAAAEAGR